MFEFADQDTQFPAGFSVVLFVDPSDALLAGKVSLVNVVGVSVCWEQVIVKKFLRRFCSRMALFELRQAWNMVSRHRFGRRILFSLGKIEIKYVPVSRL